MQETLLTLSDQQKDNNTTTKDIQLLLPPPPCRRPTRTRRVSPGAVERALPNGDIYSGSLSGNAPHGSGKYLWSDGCMYEGEWRKGKASGKGRFSWPSGATYEGEFAAGRMHGHGTFVGVEGDTYRGGWVSDRKHGFGEKRYANGDVYEGWWRCNLQEGEGRYAWRNGNEYVGEWKNGAISGKGVLVWKNGNRYEGCWENGVPKGRGVFTWRDGSTSSGNWGKEFVNEKRVSVDECCNNNNNNHSTKSVSFPRICIWELDGEAGDITCDIVETSVFYGGGGCESGGGGTGCESGGGVTGCENGGRGTGCESVQFQRIPCGSVDGDVKKPGHTVSKGHKNYDFMLNLQLGIRYSVGKHASILQGLRPGDFDPKEKFWTRFPPEGSKFTPPHQSVDFRWKDYCPVVFRHLRELFGIDPADYMLAICGNDTLRAMSSPGKSGSFFYLTQDDRFIIKTLKKSEVKVLIRMLPSYYQHVCQYKNSLVTKFLGVHCVKPIGGQKTRFIVMGNVFCSEYRIHKRFDLKGSSHGRTTDKPREEIDETTTLKDLDLCFVFRLEQSWFQELKWQLDRDCEFLEAEGIMDYSFLIGLHFRDDSSVDDVKTLTNELCSGKRDVQNDDIQDTKWIPIGRGPLIRLGTNMPARPERVCKAGLDQHTCTGSSNSTPSESGDEVSDVILYFGIIDILQDYDISKKLEHAYKSLQVDSSSISAVDPKLYSKRFRDFIHRIFVEDK